MVSSSEFLEIVENASKWKHDINYSKNPLKYEVTNDFGGMYTCEPYKTKLLHAWRFSTPKSAQQSAKKIKIIFLEYLACEDFVGADLARKYLKAGFIKKSVPKASRKFFKTVYDEIDTNKSYISLRKLFLEKKNEEQTVNEKR